MATQKKRLVFENGEVRYKEEKWEDVENIPISDSIVDNNIAEIDNKIATLQQKKTELIALKSKISQVDAANPELILGES